ncbi:remorin-like [Phalaenopsis equestris]|uniref:remorin-like n=1 Tax=Phalaenopsis equestris TaxID=78828 RepID=UPI0009E2F258|nr:remorin-like [Phalaenopsis equestris]
MSYLENLSDGEYETVVAATAYAITSLEEEEDSFKQKKTVEGLTRTKTKLEERTARKSFNWSFKWLSGEEVKQEEKQKEKDKVEKSAREKYGSRYTDAGEESDASPTLIKTPTFTKRVQSGKEATVRTKATSTKKPAELDKIETEADAWEKAEMIKAKNRYEKMMSVISEWQTEKKTKAKRRMERKQGGPEQKRAKANQHYNNELSRINKVAGNAQALTKERLQNDEMKIRGKATKIRSEGKVPATRWGCC